MGYSPKNIRLPWQDRFRKPSLDDLRDHYNKQLGLVMDAARERLRDLPGVTEELSWLGLPWRWTLSYRCNADPSRVWAYLVPDPGTLKVAMPLSSEVVSAVTRNSRIKKHVKDGVLQSRQINGVHWATWDVSTKEQLGDILELAKQKYTMMSRRN